MQLGYKLIKTNKHVIVYHDDVIIRAEVVGGEMVSVQDARLLREVDGTILNLDECYIISD